MPNHVTNIIEVKGNPARIKAMFEAVKNDEHGLGSIDFNKLIPMPPELDIEESSRTKRWLKTYKEFLEAYNFNREQENSDLESIPKKAEQAFPRVRPDVDTQTWELGKAAFQNQQRYGFATWYGFCTKWNAYGYDSGVPFDGKSLRFLTAWAPPTFVVEKLANMYPDLDFVHQWADEDIGYNCGEIEYHNGVVDSEFFPTGQEARDFANGLWGTDSMEEEEDEAMDSGMSMK